MGTRLMELTVKVLEDLWTARRERALGETEEITGEEVREVWQIGAKLLAELMQEMGKKYRGKAGFSTLKSLLKEPTPLLEPFPRLFSGSFLLSKCLSKALRQQLSRAYQAIQRLSVCYRADRRLQSALLRQVYCAWIQLQIAPSPRPCQVLTSVLGHLLWTRLKPIIAGTLGGIRALKLAQLLARKKEPHRTVASQAQTPVFSPTYRRSLTDSAFSTSNLANSLDSRHIAFQLVYQFVEMRIYRVLNRSKRRLLRWAFAEMYLVPNFEDRIELAVRKMQEVVVGNEGKWVRMRWGKWIKAVQKEEIRAKLLEYALKRQVGLVVQEESRKVDKNLKEKKRKTLGTALFAHILRENVRKNFDSLVDFQPNSHFTQPKKQQNSNLKAKQRFRSLEFASSLSSIVQKHVHFLQFQCLKAFISPPKPAASAVKVPVLVHLGTALIKRKAMWMLRAKMSNCLYIRLGRLLSLRVEMRNRGKSGLGNAFWQWKERITAEKELILTEKRLQMASKFKKSREFTPVSSKSYRNISILMEAMTASLYKRPFQTLFTQTASEKLAKVRKLSRLVGIVGQYYGLRVAEGWNALGPSTTLRSKAAYALGNAVEGLYQREKTKISSFTLKRLSGVEKNRKEEAVKRLKRAILGVKRLKIGHSFLKLMDFPAFRLFPGLSKRQIVLKSEHLSLFRTLEVLPAFQFTAFSLLPAFTLWKTASKPLLSQSNSLFGLETGLKWLKNREIVAVLAKSGREIHLLQWTAQKDWGKRSKTLAKVLISKELSDLRNCQYAAFVRWLQIRSKRPLTERLRVPTRLSLEPTAELSLSLTSKALLRAAKDRASLPVLRLLTFLAVLFKKSGKTAVEAEKAALKCWKCKEKAGFERVEMRKQRNSQLKKPAEGQKIGLKLHNLSEIVARKQITDQRAALYWALSGWEQLTCGGSWAHLAVLRGALQAKTHRDEKYTGFSRWKQAARFSFRTRPAILKTLKALLTVLFTQHPKSTRLALRFALSHWASQALPSPKQPLQAFLYRTEPISVLRLTAKSVALGKILVGRVLGSDRLGTAWAIWSARRGKFEGKLSRFGSKLEAIEALVGKMRFGWLYFAFMTWKNRHIFSGKLRKLGKLVGVKAVKDLLWSFKRPFRITTGQFEPATYSISPLFLRLKALSIVLITQNQSKLPFKVTKTAFLLWKLALKRTFDSHSSHSLAIQPLSAHHRAKQLSIDRLTGLQIISPSFTPQVEKLTALNRVVTRKRLTDIGESEGNSGLLPTALQKIWKLWAKLTKVANLPYRLSFKPSLQPLFLALTSATHREQQTAQRTAIWKWTGKSQLLPISAVPGKLQALAAALLIQSAKQGTDLPYLWKRWRMQRQVLDLPFSPCPGQIATGLQPFPLQRNRSAREDDENSKAELARNEGERNSADLEKSHEQTNGGKSSLTTEQRSRVEVLVQALTVQSAKCTLTLPAAWVQLSQPPVFPSKSHHSRDEMPRQPAVRLTEEEKTSRRKSKAFGGIILWKIARDQREATRLIFAKLPRRKQESDSIYQGKYEQFARVLARNQLQRHSNPALEYWLQWKTLLCPNPSAAILTDSPIVPVSGQEQRESARLRHLAKVIGSEKARAETDRLGPALRQWNRVKAPKRLSHTERLEAPFTPSVTLSLRDKRTLPPSSQFHKSTSYEGNPFEVEETEARKVLKLPFSFITDEKGVGHLEMRIKLLAGVLARQTGRNDIQKLWGCFFHWRNPLKFPPEMPVFPNFSHSSSQLSALAKVLVGRKLKESDITLPEAWAEWNKQPEAITSPKSGSLSPNSSRNGKLRSSRSLAASSPRSPVDIEERERREKVGKILKKQQGKAGKEALRKAWKRWTGPLSMPLQFTKEIDPIASKLNAQTQDRPGEIKESTGEIPGKEGLKCPDRLAQDIQPEIEFSPDWETRINDQIPQKTPKEALDPEEMETLRTNRLKSLASVLVSKGVREENLSLQRAFWQMTDQKAPLKHKSLPERPEKRKKLTSLAKALVNNEQNGIKFRLGSAWLALGQVSYRGKLTQALSSLLPAQDLRPEAQDWSQSVPAKAGNPKSRAKRSAPAGKPRPMLADLPVSSGENGQKGSDWSDIDGEFVVPTPDLPMPQRQPSFSPLETDFIVESEYIPKAQDSAPISHRDSEAEDLPEGIKVPGLGKKLRNSAKTSPKHANIEQPSDILSLWKQQSAPVSPVHRARKPPIPQPIEDSKQAFEKPKVSFPQFPVSKASSSTSKEPQASLKVSWDSPLTEDQFYGKEPESPTFYQDRPWDSRKGSKEGSDLCEVEGIVPLEEQEIVISSPHIPVLPKRLQARSQRSHLQSSKSTPKPQALAAAVSPSLTAILLRKTEKSLQFALFRWKNRTKMPHIVLRKVKTMSSAPRNYAHFRGEVTYLKGNFGLWGKKIEQLQALISRKEAKRLVAGFIRWRDSLRSRRVLTSPTSDMSKLRLRPVTTHSSKQKQGKTFDWQRAEQSSRLEIKSISSLSKSFWRPAAGEKRIAVLSPRSRTALPSPSGAGSFLLSPRALPLYSSPYLLESYATLQFLARP